jgi:hypothetical protein
VDYPSDANTTLCFGQRMLSPFRGVMHSVVTRWADAVTTDGRQWTLYVRGACLYDDPAAIADPTVSIPDVKYGSWSSQAGFRRAPIRMPTFDQRVREEGEHLLASVQRHAEQLPFPLADRFELWLLHGDTGLPLALIGSSCDAAGCEAPLATRWTPGRICMAELPAARELHALIARLAGPAPRAQWFERRPDGSAAVHPAPATASDTLASARFPGLLIDADALDPAQLRLLHTLLQWQSPSLLQLPNLTRLQRARFEAAACGYAVRLAEQLPLYPCVLDRAAVTAALVEARLRRSRPDHGGTAAGHRALSPDYIEIPDD